MESQILHVDRASTLWNYYIVAPSGFINLFLLNGSSLKKKKSYSLQLLIHSLSLCHCDNGWPWSTITFTNLIIYLWLFLYQQQFWGPTWYPNANNIFPSQWSAVIRLHALILLRLLDYSGHTGLQKPHTQTSSEMVGSQENHITAAHTQPIALKAP